MPQVGLPFLVGITGPCRIQSSLNLSTDQRRVLQQAKHLTPDNLIMKILLHRARVAHRSVQMSPRIGRQTSVIADFVGT